MRLLTPHSFSILMAVTAGAITLLAAEPKWRPLFDGTTLKGWKQMQGEAKFEVRDGAIVGIVVEGVPAHRPLRGSVRR